MLIKPTFIKKCSQLILETTSKKSVVLNDDLLSKFLGYSKFRSGEIEKKNLIGITNGLAWTEVGGEILSIETILSLGKGRLSITGKLGDVMKESVQAAISYVKSNSINLGIHPYDFDKYDIHVHVPEGATPKDGPSAGVAIFNSLVSRSFLASVNRLLMEILCGVQSNNFSKPYFNLNSFNATILDSSFIDKGFSKWLIKSSYA